MNKRTFVKSGFFGLGSLFLVPKAYSLEYYPMPSDKKIAVIFATWCGSTRDAALWISEGMDGIANVFDVRENPDLRLFDHVIIGGAIRSGKVSPLLEEYIQKNKDILKKKICGYFAVCGNMMQPVSPERKKAIIDDYIAKLCDVQNVPSKVFLGRVTFGLMDPESKKMMQQMPGITEYDNLKRPECLVFGKEILAGIG
jgi:menaquinone-dependent protoporphyrinogen IX oxidase